MDENTNYTIVIVHLFIWYLQRKTSGPRQGLMGFSEPKIIILVFGFVTSTLENTLRKLICKSDNYAKPVFSLKALKSRTLAV